MTEKTAPRTSAEQRERSIQRLVAGTTPNTRPLLEALLAESTYPANWKPLRAAMEIMVVEDHGRVWMSPEQLTTWKAEAKALCRARGLPTTRIHDHIGMSAAMLKVRCAGSVPVTKLESLACAHFAFGLDLPIAAGDARAFADWFRPLFGGTTQVSRWLGIDHDMIDARMAGFAIRGGKRFERSPEIGMIRALDWLIRIGPITPYSPVPAR
ncbi:MAG: hypothetical protein KKA05_10320 [Alphaproteobacteria bacterium]|nr:hypothetical protein [Alphaproteobacteria bacterium]